MRITLAPSAEITISLIALAVATSGVRVGFLGLQFLCPCKSPPSAIDHLANILAFVIGECIPLATRFVHAQCAECIALSVHRKLEVQTLGPPRRVNDEDVG